MKVKELIEILQGYSPDCDVAIEGAMHLDPVTPDHYLWNDRMVILFDPQVLEAIENSWQEHDLPDTIFEREDC